MARSSRSVFTCAEKRPVLKPRADTPLIGVGDLLRYTGDRQQPGDRSGGRQCGRSFGPCHNRLVHDRAIPDSWSPFLCHPGVKDGNPLFGNKGLVSATAKNRIPKSSFRSRLYARHGGGTVNRDKLPDLVFASMLKSSDASKVPDVADYIHIYINSGKYNTGMPILVYTDRVRHPKDHWGPVRIVNLDGDGNLDFTVGGLHSEVDPRSTLFATRTPPADHASANTVEIKPGAMAGFDVDGDGTLDTCFALPTTIDGAIVLFAAVIAWHEA